MSQERQCCYCQKISIPPEILPYLTENGPVWAHQKCEQQVREARRIPELHFPPAAVGGEG
jgi:hypothetical protein